MTTKHEHRRPTLAEIVVGLGLGLLAAVLVGVLVLSSVWNGFPYPNEKAAECDIANLSTSVEMYRVARNHNPTSVEDLLDAGVIAKATKDPWGHDYLIVCPSEEGLCGILSAGKDGMFGTADDIRSWGEPEPPPNPRASA